MTVKKVVIVALMLFVFCTVSLAQALGVGYVDLERVLNNFTNAQELQKQYQELASNLQNIVNRHLSNFMLTSEERVEFKQLIAKPTLTESEKKRLEELENLAAGRQRELQELENLQNLTDAQKQRLTELQGLRNQASSDIDAVVKEYNDQLNRKRDELTAKMEGEIKSKLAKLGITVKENEDLTVYIKQAVDKAIAEVAKANNLSLVLSSQVVLFGGVDITDKVIKALNK